MPDYNLRHIDISHLAGAERYKSRSSGPRTRYQREREAHADRLIAELDSAFGAADELKPDLSELPDGQSAADGSYLVVDLHPSGTSTPLEKKREGTREGTQKELPSGERQVVLHVPDEGRAVLMAVLEDYGHGELTEKGNPPKMGRVAPIERIRHAQLLDLWRDDPADLPTEPQARMWWGMWCWPDRLDDVRTFAERLGAMVAPEDRWVTFPKAVVLPINARRAEIELLLYGGNGGVAEIGLVTDNPSIIMDDFDEFQDDLVADLAERITWPGQDAAAVCVLDCGANRAHPLLEPALAMEDQQAVDPAWGVDDHHPRGHGTGMAGLSLHGDLTVRLADASEPILTHRLETVTVMPPAGFPANDPANYGAITSSAISLAEVEKPERSRVICMAVTNEDRPGVRPTQWSASLDRLAAGADQINETENPQRRLIVQSIGNVPPSSTWTQVSDSDDFPGEDPSQAWNALAVGGVTYLDDIQDAGFEDWSPAVGVGHPSPYGRTSTGWPDASSPVKPDVVFEAGNRALSPDEPVMDGLPSLSVLTTGKGGVSGPLAPFWATSAATAQSARLAARLSSAYPEYWPETVRALMAHSARWTPPMLGSLNAAENLTERKPLRRRFGYGAPDVARAMQSAESDLALVAQAYIQPFRREKGQTSFGQAHYYTLPWPRDILEGLENTPVRLRVALSYFIEPNPTSAATIDPARYRSFGLRFDLKRSRESEARFRARTSAALGAGGSGGDPNDKWLFGPKSVSAGSLHVDVWEGPAVELAARNEICVFPVTGWWRERPSLGMVNRKARYALVLGLESPDVDVDLYTEVEQMLNVGTSIEVET
ncbi:MAG: S8 family peptidase [Pseudomonadota bacterium]